MSQSTQTTVTIEELQARVDKLEQLILKYKGIHNPFICGGSKETGDDGLPNIIFVAPAMGADGFAIYQKVKNYSAPSY